MTRLKAGGNLGVQPKALMRPEFVKTNEIMKVPSAGMISYNPDGEPQVAGVSANSVEIVKALYRDMSDSTGTL